MTLGDGGFSESSTVQAAIIRRLGRPDLGWRHVPGRQLDRSTDMVLIESEVVEALRRLNPVIDKAPVRVDEVLPLLRAVCLSAVSDGLTAANERMVTWLRGTQAHKFVGTDAYAPIRLIDFDTP